MKRYATTMWPRGMDPMPPCETHEWRLLAIQTACVDPHQSHPSYCTIGTWERVREKREWIDLVSPPESEPTEKEKGT